ncbi:MAG: Holliday junction resolvase RuvX [Gammaproteobacteria bacterium]
MPQFKTVLGFDFGTRRIGVSIGQRVTRTAQPLLTLQTDEEGATPWQRIEALIKEWQPDRLVVGLPYNEAFNDQSTYQAALSFIEMLKSKFNIPVDTIDEHLSSFAAKAIMRERGIKPNKVPLDAMAATIILESWLNTHE